MSLAQITALSAIEILGDFSLKNYANDKGILYLFTGIIGYIGVVIFLIVSLQGSNIILVNTAWDGVSTLLEGFAAYIILGERFDNYLQYVGYFLIVVGLFLLKIPITDSHPFRIPKL